MYASKLNEVKNGYNNKQTNQRKCTCRICKTHIIPKGEGIAYTGGYNGGGYICKYCFNEMETKPTTKGTEKANGFFISPSFDSYYINDDIANYLKSLGYTIKDNTSFEGVTYSGIKGLSTILKRLDLENIDIISSSIIISKEGLNNGYILNDDIVEMLINNGIVNNISLENGKLNISCDYKNKDDYFNKLRIYQKIINIIISNKNIDYKLKREVSKHI